MRQAQNWLIVGASGSGKTEYAKRLIAAYKPRARFGVIINSTSQLSEYANRKEYVSLETLKNHFDPVRLSKLIRASGWIHFEVTGVDTPEKFAFLESLFEAVWLLGKMDTTQCECVVIADEARLVFRKHRMGFWAKRLEAEGRKFGIDIIKIDQRFGAQDNDTTDMAARIQITRLVVFPTSDRNQRKALQNMGAPIPDPITLERPIPKEKLGGEYVVSDYLRGQAWVQRRKGRKFVLEKIA
jgi:hypothetical protein